VTSDLAAAVRASNTGRFALEVTAPDTPLGGETMATSVRLHRRTCAFERQDVGIYGSYSLALHLTPPNPSPFRLIGD
jgi:hypothetical protein